jgi:hypothetical protein
MEELMAALNQMAHDLNVLLIFVYIFITFKTFDVVFRIVAATKASIKLKGLLKVIDRKIVTEQTKNEIVN